MEKTINVYSIFESIKHINKNGIEFWYARELMIVLEYSKWEKFTKVISKAIASCNNSNLFIEDHFPQVGKMVQIGSNSVRKIYDYELSRYACYLIAQNADSRKKVVSLAQTYFAIQTRKQEIIERLSLNDKERLFQREVVKKKNKVLLNTARCAGVKNFDRFNNSGYKGLYNGETANEIAKRKKLRYNEDILDNMDTDELIANLFRISQTEQRIRNKNIVGEKDANETHYIVGKDIRRVILKQGNTPPEKLPTPDKSIKELKKWNKDINNKQAKNK